MRCSFVTACFISPHLHVSYHSMLQERAKRRIWWTGWACKGQPSGGWLLQAVNKQRNSDLNSMCSLDQSDVLFLEARKGLCDEFTFVERPEGQGGVSPGPSCRESVWARSQLWCCSALGVLRQRGAQDGPSRVFASVFFSFSETSCACHGFHE